ncbi:hypothetical protein [Agromyces sp. SYSU T0242]|uniref:hypothetical protein n=1 Tax=Agromyces litoreus TaxID=3158561 RepID=UPI003392BDA4
MLAAGCGGTGSESGLEDDAAGAAVPVDAGAAVVSDDLSPLAAAARAAATPHSDVDDDLSSLAPR